MNSLIKDQSYTKFIYELKLKIKEAQNKTLKSINRNLIKLYWEIGQIIVRKQKENNWGKSIVKNISTDLQKEFPGIKGFSSQNLWYMRQFFIVYQNNTKLQPLVGEISWTNHLLILSKTKTTEEREFYLQLCIKEKYSKRELERQLNSSFYERSIISNSKVSPMVSQITPHFKDTYILDFLDLPKNYSEKDLQTALIENFKDFVLEIGKDFAFLGQEYRIQVGNNDYYIDLLFYHRSLQCLVAFELKIEDFKPEFLGKLNFYLEALDRDIKKIHENPSVGVILCKSKDTEVAEYSLSRNLSPALISEYKTKLIDKKLLKKKFKELYDLSK